MNRTSRLRDSGAYHLMNVTSTSRQNAFMQQPRDSLLAQQQTPNQQEQSQQQLAQRPMFPTMQLSGNYFN